MDDETHLKKTFRDFLVTNLVPEHVDGSLMIPLHQLTMENSLRSVCFGEVFESLVWGVVHIWAPAKICTQECLKRRLLLLIYELDGPAIFWYDLVPIH